MKRAIIVMIFLVVALLSVSCGNENIIGYWESVYEEHEGECYEAIRVLTIDIKDNGKAVFSYTQSSTLETNWIEKDGYFIIDPDGAHYKAWIENKMLVIDDPEYNWKLFLVKDLKNFSFPPNIKKGVRIE